MLPLKQSPPSTSRSPPRATPPAMHTTAELWFALGSVAVTWSFVVPRDRKVQINSGALKQRGVGAGWRGSYWASSMMTSQAGSC